MNKIKVEMYKMEEGYDPCPSFYANGTFELEMEFNLKEVIVQALRVEFKGKSDRDIVEYWQRMYDRPYGDIKDIAWASTAIQRDGEGELGEPAGTFPLSEAGFCKVYIDGKIVS
jgi:hypothetical protein